MKNRKKREIKRKKKKNRDTWIEKQVQQFVQYDIICHLHDDIYIVWKNIH